MIGRGNPRNTPPCDNRNHVRRNAPVSHCPKCGEVVNDELEARNCTEEEHGTARRRQNPFCCHCGMRLLATA